MTRLLTNVVLLFALAACAFAADRPAPLLPELFAGWQKTSPHTSADASQADAANGPLLKEYGFTEYESATYTAQDRKLTIKAARFNDASGAYGAFTFYKRAEMQPETIGDLAVSEGRHVVFYRGNILVDAVFDRVTAMSAAELRDLARELPVPRTEAGKPPDLPGYLPRQSYIANSVKYVVGPVGLEAIGQPLPAQLVDFRRNAELVTGKYTTGEGVATVVILSYPTPAIAADRLRAIEAANPAPAPGTSPSLNLRRSGPLVALVTGDISEKEAKSLLAAINYEADVTWNEATSLSKRDNIGNLIVNVFVLIGILLLFALMMGVMFGGVRVVLKRLFPNRVFDRPEDVEIIRLNLRQ